jgi:hypothetical protein
MLERKLIRFYRTHSENRAQRRWGCLSESDIAAYADHRVTGGEKDRIEAHLADCDFCLNQVAFLARLSEAAVPESIPSSLLSRAQELARPRPRFGLGWAWRWEAVAATVAGLAVVVVLSLRNPGTVVPPLQPPTAVAPTSQAPSGTTSKSPSTHVPSVPSASAPAPTVRQGTMPPLRSTPALIFPRPNAVIPTGQVEFSWTGVRNALYYEVRLVTADGDLVWETRTEENSAPLPASVSLPTGQKYFVWVQAFLAEGKTTKSTAIGFTVAARD